MNSEQHNLEVKVGFFVLAGLIAIAVMAIEFGRVGQGLNNEYPITVEFPNASGLIKDSFVKLAGAVVGHVAETPQPIPGHVDVVSVSLKIQEGIKFPIGSTFGVGSSGLLGDKFVQVSPPRKFDARKFNSANPVEVIAPSAVVSGSDTVDLSDLMEPGKAALDKMAARLDDLQSVIVDIKTKVLSAENMANLHASFASIKTTADNFASASRKADTIMDGAKDTVGSAREVMATARQTMATANAAATDIRAAVGDLRGVIKTADETLGSARGVLKTAQTGNGTIPMLLANREVADNLRALIANIRRHGLLFYRDNAALEIQPGRQPAIAAKIKPRP